MCQNLYESIFLSLSLGSNLGNVSKRKEHSISLSLSLSLCIYIYNIYPFLSPTLSIRHCIAHFMSCAIILSRKSLKIIFHYSEKMINFKSSPCTTQPFLSAFSFKNILICQKNCHIAPIFLRKNYLVYHYHLTGTLISGLNLISLNNGWKILLFAQYEILIIFYQNYCLHQLTPRMNMNKSYKLILDSL